MNLELVLAVVVVVVVVHYIIVVLLVLALFLLVLLVTTLVLVIAELDGAVPRAAEPAQLLDGLLTGRERRLPEARECRRTRILCWRARRWFRREALTLAEATVNHRVLRAARRHPFSLRWRRGGGAGSARCTGDTRPSSLATCAATAAALSRAASALDSACRVGDHPGRVVRSYTDHREGLG